MESYFDRDQFCYDMGTPQARKMILFLGEIESFLEVVLTIFQISSITQDT